MPNKKVVVLKSVTLLKVCSTAKVLAYWQKASGLHNTFFETWQYFYQNQSVLFFSASSKRPIAPKDTGPLEVFRHNFITGSACLFSCGWTSKHNIDKIRVCFSVFIIKSIIIRWTSSLQRNLFFLARKHEIHIFLPLCNILWFSNSLFFRGG